MNGFRRPTITANRDALSGTLEQSALSCNSALTLFTGANHDFLPQVPQP